MKDTIILEQIKEIVLTATDKVEDLLLDEILSAQDYPSRLLAVQAYKTFVEIDL